MVSQYLQWVKQLGILLVAVVMSLLCKDWITLNLHKEPCPVSNCYICPYSAALYTTTYVRPSSSSFSLPPTFYHLFSSASLHLLFPQLFIPPHAALLLSHSFVFHTFLSVPLSSFCSASFLSSLLSVDSEIPVLRKFQLSLAWVYGRSRDTSM